MPEVAFTCLGAEPAPFAAGPTITLQMRATAETDEPVHALALRCQVRIDAPRRRYEDAEAEGLTDLFGDRARWGHTMRQLQLAFLGHVLPGFTGGRDFELELPCSYDVEVAAHKYLAALTGGEVPLVLLFSGTVFSGAPGSISVSPVPWHSEAQLRMPVRVWQETMDAHFPGQAWLRLDRDTWGRLAAYRSRHQLVGWDDAVERLLKEAGEE